MGLRIVLTLSATVVALILTPKSATACSCGRGWPPWQSNGDSGSVFIGRVTSVELSAVTFAVMTVFNGPAMQSAILKQGGGSCDVSFALHETYFVYARFRDETLRTNTCTRTRPLSAAKQDVKYFEGLQQGRAQGVLSGMVHRRGMDARGETQLFMLDKAARIVAVGDGTAHETTTENGGDVMLVLPPGEFHVWVERGTTGAR